MKYRCLDIDNCGFVRKVHPNELKNIDYNNPYKICEECTSLMVLEIVSKGNKNDPTFYFNPTRTKK